MKINELRKYLENIGNYGELTPRLNTALEHEKQDLKLQVESEEALLTLSKDELQIIFQNSRTITNFANDLIIYHPKVLLKMLALYPEMISALKSNEFIYTLPYNVQSCTADAFLKIIETLKNAGLNLEPIYQTTLEYSLRHDNNLALTKYLLQLKVKSIQEPLELSSQKAVLPTFITSQASPGNLKLLIEHGLNINSQDSDGNTLLHYASELVQFQMLLKLGADPKIKNKKEKVPLVIQLERYLDGGMGSAGSEAIIEFLIRQMNTEESMHWKEYWELNWTKLYRWTIDGVREKKFLQIIAFFDQKYNKARDIIDYGAAVLGVSTSLPYSIEGYRGFSAPKDFITPTICTEFAGRTARSNQSFEWLCNFLEQFVKAIENTDPDKKILLEILEAHQFTRTQLSEMNLSQKLWERHSQGKLVIIPNAGWQEHTIGLALKGTAIFMGNRGGKLGNEPYGACRYQAKLQQPHDLLSFITEAQRYSDSNSSVSLREGRTQFTQAILRMIDLSKPEAVAIAKRQKHDTCFLVNHLINIQIILKSFGSENAHKKYKEMTSQFRDFFIQNLVDEFNKAKKSNHHEIVNILKMFVRKILVEHYNIKKSGDQETLRAAELLKIFDSKEQKEVIEQIGQEIKEKWIVCRIFELDKSNVCKILKEYDKSSGATFHPIDETIDLDGFAIRINYLSEHQFRELFDRIVYPTSRPNHDTLTYSEKTKIPCSPESLQKILAEAETYFKEIVAPFFAKAQSAEIQQKTLTFSNPLEKKKEAEQAHSQLQQDNKLNIKNHLLL